MYLNDVVKEKKTKAQQVLSEAKALLEKPGCTETDKARASQLLKEGTAFVNEAKQMADILDAASDVLGPSGAIQRFSTNDPARGSTFGDWGEFVASATKALRDRGNQPDSRLAWFSDKADGLPSEAKQMVESVGASGGFLVPTEFYGQLQAVAAEDAIVRPRATIIRMARRQVDIPVLDQTGTATGRSNFFGGCIFYHAEEAGEKTLTDFDFRKVSLVAHKLIGYTRASDELVEDSAISFNDFISGPLGFAGGVVWTEDYEFLRGTGVGQPLGILNAGCTITVARQVGGTVSYIDLANMLESFLPSGRGVWVLSHTLRAQLMQLQDPSGAYVWQPNAREGLPQTLFGFPVYFTEKLPAAGTSGDVLLADFRYYLLGDRKATTIESTQYDYWRHDQTSWRVVHRYDGQPFLSTFLTGADGTSTFSPFVILGDKST